VLKPFDGVSVIFLRTAVLTSPTVRRTRDDAHKGQFPAALPGLWREKRSIAAANQLFSRFMMALADAYGLDLPLAGLPAARTQVRKTLTATPFDDSP
jgi:hypothetical protein